MKQSHTGCSKQKAADMSGIADRTRNPVHNLKQVALTLFKKPEADGRQSRQLEGEKHDGREQPDETSDSNTTLRKKIKIGAHHRGYGSRGAHGRDSRRLTAQEVVREQAGNDPCAKVEDQIAEMAEAPFHVIPGDPKKPHVAEQMGNTGVKKQRGQHGQGQPLDGTVTMVKNPMIALAHFHSGQENQDIQNQQEIGYPGNALTGGVVVDGDQHELSIPPKLTKKGAHFLRCEGDGLMQDYLNTAVRAARCAGKLIFDRFGDQQLGVRHKGRIDLVTEVDVACEKELRKVILGDWPDHAILGEEEGRKGEGKALWIVDPLDGTRSFAHGYPFVCVSVALEIEGRVEVGVVYDPLRDELFHAVRGQGAFLNQQPIGVSRCESLEQALLVTGFPYHLAEFDSSALFGLFRDFVVGSGGIRRDGSAAMDFCYVACGRLDGYWEFFLHPWDAAAGALIAAEAGARVSNLGGGAYDIRVAEVLCCSPAIHPAMVRVAAPYLESMRRLLR